MRKEFGLTLSEFLRDLGRLSADFQLDDDGRRLCLPWPPGEVEICFGEARPRRLGALCLPLLPVEFRFHNLNADERAGFLRRFERAFQRGGG